jgi:hypothetical protein
VYAPMNSSNTHQLVAVSHRVQTRYHTNVSSGISVRWMLLSAAVVQSVWPSTTLLESETALLKVTWWACGQRCFAQTGQLCILGCRSRTAHPHDDFFQPL